MDFTINLSGMHPAVQHAVIKGLQHEDKAKHDLGVLEQMKLKQMMDKVMAPGVNNEVGRPIMIMTQAQRNMAMRIYGDKFFADPDSTKFLLKHHPDFRIKDVGTRIQSGYSGRRDESWRTPTSSVASPLTAHPLHVEGRGNLKGGRRG